MTFQDIKWIESPFLADSLVFDVDSLKQVSHTRGDTLLKDSIQVIGSTVLENKNKIIRHKIVKGESLKSIARLYHVKGDELRKTNGLQNSKIIEGNYLNVEIGEAVAKKSSEKSGKPRSKKASRDKYVMHKVAEGETLSELAEKYKVPVTQIKKLNGLKSSRIKTGHSLKIKLKAVSASGG